ncbi:unnamed protein product [Caenorhabditis bovis]|uniref:XPG-I domain-containing protein n=1 Tax=Caenorhabditis bovis TaxID=2654633 RepID=A0A8S1EWV9_9PELO|nr:unnamed protein product [Caenorhabditis bovis]
MTIHGIWQWAANHSQTVEIDALRNKTLSIDGHIWLYECHKGGQRYNQTGASYLVTFFRRCRFLMERNIRPIVVFDAVNRPPQPGSFAFSERKNLNWHDLTNSSNLADRVFKCQAMLRHLGVTVIIAKGEGEAQCAELEMEGITDGCITTDFDYFIFGGRNLYKIQFNTNGVKSIMHCSMDNLEANTKIYRNGLIAMAILLGCDFYDSGVENCGIVTALDVLTEFHGREADHHPLQILDRFASYVRGEVPERSEDSERKLRLKRREYGFDRTFPNTDEILMALKIYENPNTYTFSKDTFTSPPCTDLRRVERILVHECGWTAEKMKQELEISEKRSKKFHEATIQKKIPDFFKMSKRTNSLVEQCSVDEYLKSNNNWFQQRKRRSDVSPSSSTTPQSSRTRTPKISKISSSHKSSDDSIEIIEILDSD